MNESAPGRELLASLQKSLDVIEKLESELARMREEIALIGMSCRFPGAGDLEAFWELLRDGVDAITEVPASRWDMDAFYDPDPDAPGKLYCRFGGFLDQVDRFDPLFFGISPKEAARMDPQQRLLLEVSWEALEHAGQPPRSLRQSRTGVFVGIAENDYARLVERANNGTGFDHYDATGTGFCFASGRLSHVLGLQGPNVALDTGCSSSLVAIHQAVSSLRLGECDLALAGGVHLRLTVTTSLPLAKTRALSPDGRCKTFDASADGFGRSEGCGMIVLKRLSDAQRDGDTILAVIRGSAVNHDGPASGFTVPNEGAQVDLLRAALANARVEPGAVSCIEAHGTGTVLGDPIEVSALAEVFAGHPRTVALGSVKSNIGHTEGAAGIAGVIKTVLALQHETIPPHLHLQEPNPLVPWDDLPFVVPTEPRPWPEEEGRRIAGVSSFGMSGTNAHVVLASAPRSERSHRGPERPLHVLALSAKSRRALGELARRYEDFLERARTAEPAVELADVCFTANTGRSHFEHRLCVVASTPDQMRERLAAWRAGSRVRGAIDGHAPSHRPAPRIAFLFTGQGSQHAGMGRVLYETQPTFRRALDRCAEILAPRLAEPLLAVLFSEDAAGKLDRTAFAQPALFALEYSLAELWRSWGIEPDLVIGHSVGEYVAACVAGVFSLEEGLALVAERGRLIEALAAGGAMASVHTELPRVEAALAPYDRVAVAAINGPREIVVSGDGAQIAAVVTALTEQGIECRPLTVSHAFHSPLLEPVVEPFARAARAVRLAAPRIPLVSNLTGGILAPEAACDPEHWVRHLRAPVRFAEGLACLLEQGVEVLLEIGPRPVLLGLGRSQSDGDDTAWLPSLRPGKEWFELLDSLAHLHVRGAAVDWTGFDHDFVRRKLALPTYPFERQRYWVPEPAHDHLAAGTTARVGPLLDKMIRSPLHDATLFETALGVTTLPFLADHRIHDCLVAPAACHLAMVVSAAEAAFGMPVTVLEDVVFPRALIVPDHGLRTVQVVLTAAAEGGPEFQLVSLEARGSASESVIPHAIGRIAGPAPTAPARTEKWDQSIESLRARATRELDVDAFYRRLSGQGIVLGSSFRWIARLWSGDGEALAEIARPAAAGAALPLHPGLLDACLQTTEALAMAGDDGQEGAPRPARLPFAIRHLRLDASAAGRARWVHARRTAAERWDVDLVDADGRLVAELAGFEDRAAPRAALRARPAWHDWLQEVRWRVLEGDPPLVEGPVEDVIFVADGPAPDDVPACAEALCNRLLHLTQALARRPAPPRLWIVTRTAQAVTAGEALRPEQSPVWGLARAIAAEHPELRCTCVDLDVIPEDGRLPLLLAELAGASDERRLALRNGRLHVWQLAPLQPPEGQVPPVRLALADYGSPDDLRLVPLVRHAPRPREVEIEVRAAGLNFRDVLIALGMLRDHEADVPQAAPPLGYECAGVVAAVGAEVTEFGVGDPVIAMTEGAFASHALAEAGQTARLPAGLSFAEGATIPLAFLTAHYALRRLAQLRPGERVLIHSAAGGVGQAAVQIARAAGAEVFATASAAKWPALEAMGVRHVLSSRTLDFGGRILAATAGRGVDVVLNSLSGEHVAASLAALAPGGRFVEIGKLGIWEPSRMAAERPDVAYFPFDLGDEAAKDPALVPEMLAELGASFADGTLAPLPMKVFPLSQAREAYRHMQQARHIGKVVLALPPAAAVLRAGASYLVTGGLGGLGLRIGRRLAAEGAGHLVLAGRRAVISDEAREAIAAMERAGATVRVLAADVADEADVARLLAACAERGPLRGVVHAAGVLDDGILAHQTPERFRTVLAPKVRGTWNLDRLTRGMPLDFFVAFSSVATLQDDGGQGNYAAANAFLDAAMAGRRAAGLPGLAINWGPWSEVGMAARLEDRLAAAGLELIPPDQGLDALMALLAAAPAQVAVFSKTAGGPSRTAAPTPPSAARAAAAASWRQRLSEAPASDRAVLLKAYVESLFAELLGLAADHRVDPRAAFSELGMDSLLVVELRNRLQRDLELPLPPTIAFDHPTIEALGRHLARELGFQADRPAAAEPEVPEQDLRALLDEELQLLADEEGRWAP